MLQVRADMTPGNAVLRSIMLQKRNRRAMLPLLVKVQVWVTSPVSLFTSSVFLTRTPGSLNVGALPPRPPALPSSGLSLEPVDVAPLLSPRAPPGTRSATATRHAPALFE